MDRVVANGDCRLDRFLDLCGKRGDGRTLRFRLQNDTKGIPVNAGQRVLRP